VRLAEHEKSSWHLQAGVQCFEAEQRLTKGCSLDSSHHIYHLPLDQTFIVFGYMRVQIGEKTTTSKSRYINVKDTPNSHTTEWKLQCGLIGKAKIVNVVQHTYSCSSCWTAMCFYFINQPWALYIAFRTFFLHSVTWYLWNISNSWRTVCIGIQVHALRMTIKLGFWGTLSGCMVCSLVKSVFFRVLRHAEYSWSCAQTLPSYKNTSALLVAKLRNVNQFILC